MRSRQQKERRTPTVGAVLDALEVEAPPDWPADALARELKAPRPLSTAGPSDLTFANVKAIGRQPERIKATPAGLVLAAEETVPLLENAGLVLPVANPRLAFARAVRELFLPPSPSAGIHPTAIVAPGVEVSDEAHVGAYCSVGEGSVVGPGCVLYPSVTLYPGVRLGRGVVIHSGSVLGAPGFGYERSESGVLVGFPQLGGVVVEDDVEIGANTCIDRGGLSDTVIGARTRIDNLVHIAHGVKIGEDCAVIAHAEISGSCVLGDRTWVAPGALVLESVSIGADAFLGLGAVVLRPVAEGTTVVGNPARPLDRKT